MKELLILRHAKSDWSQDGMNDSDRPLNDRGRADALLMGRFIKNADIIPQHIYISPARRAQETWQGVSSTWDVQGLKTETIPHLYLAAAPALLSVIAQCPAECDSVMIIAHNPGMEELVSALCGVDVNVQMATATLAQLRSDYSSWGQIHETDMILKGLFYPRILKKVL